MSGRIRKLPHRRRKQPKLPILLIIALLAGCYIFAATGCVRPSKSVDAPVVTVPPSPTPEYLRQEPYAWEEKHPNTSWGDHVEKILSASEVPSLPYGGLEGLCPSYPALSQWDRTLVWTHLISIMAKYESNFDPSMTYEEDGITDANGKNVISTGLLQISVESANSYGCRITQAGLLDPQKNLTCGVKILEQSLRRDSIAIGKCIRKGKYQYCGGSAYWSVLREHNGSQPRKSFREIKSYMASLRLCSK